MNKFIVQNNIYLKKDTIGYYHQFYTGYGQPENPDFLNKLKNTFDGEDSSTLTKSRNIVKNIIMEDLASIIKNENMSDCVCLCVPRAKSLEIYSDSQLMFKEAVSCAAAEIEGITDGTDYIKRIMNTKTTHLRNAINIPNDGDEPYPGITADTCEIDQKKIMNRNIILVDDIYTRNVNIDEDCIQALLNDGADKVVFYAVGFTRRFQ